MFDLDVGITKINWLIYIAMNLIYTTSWFTQVREKSWNFHSLLNMNSTYGYCSLLKMVVKNLIEHPILDREVFIYIHIITYCLHIYLYFIQYKL